ncbi:MAG: SLC13 family permease [Actinobacteria bacterium]|nr:SLC13 family permease [Actinomycetota bacterium]
MTGDAWVTLAVLAASLGLLIWDRLAPSAVMLAATVSLLILDVIPADQAFSGFANPAPITVAALYILAHAVEKTGLLTPITSRLLGEGGGRSALARLLLPASVASSFLNNTPLVAMLIPDVVSWAERRRLSASRFLMPLSFATILGGTLTVLGTSTNLVVSGLLEQDGREPLGMFEITRFGAPVMVIGIVLLLLTAGRLVPARRTAQQQAEEEFREFVVTMEVIEGGPHDGRTVAESGLKDQYGAFIVDIHRAGQRVAPVGPDEVLEGGDELVFVGRADHVVDLQRAPGLRPGVQPHLDAVTGSHHTFYEAVIGRTSPMTGRTLGEVGFRGRYQAAVVAVHRDGQRIRGRIDEVRLRAGDTMLVLAGPDFPRNWKERRDFLVIAHLGGATPQATRQAPVVGLIALAMIAVATSGFMSILEAALLAAGALVVLRVLTANEVRDAIDFDVVVLIGAAFGLGAAVETTGLAQRLAAGLVTTFDGLGTPGIVFGVLLATLIITEVITNNAAAVVVFPIAMSVAATAGIDTRTMAIALAVTASCSFLTPIGYQTNTMVYGPGGYRFTDYLRLGAPLSLTVLTVVTTLVAMSG